MHDNQFTVGIKDLEKGPIELSVNTDAATLELEDADFTFPDPITGSVTFMLARPRVIARGRLNTVTHSQCVRCLAEAVTRISAPVDVIYENEKDGW